MNAVLSLVSASPGHSQVNLRVNLGAASIRVDGTSGRDEGTFGSIDAAVISYSGIVIVADRSQRRLVLIFPSVERDVRVVGRTGSGPGELREPKSLQLVDDSVVTLLDRGLSRFTRFTMSGIGLRIAGTTAVTPRPDDACYLRDRLVAFRYDPVRRMMLHWARTPTAPERYVGRPFEAGSGFLEEELSQGQVLCAADAGRVVLAAFAEGEVRGYSATGDSVWTTSIPNVVPWDVAETSGGGIAWRFRRVKGVKQAHSLASVVRIDANHVLVQYGLEIQGQPNRASDLTFARVESSLLRLRDGAIVGRQSDLPVIKAANGRLAVSAGGSPDLWIAVRPYTLRPTN